MRVRLTVKLAEVVEGVDLSHYAEGDVIELRDAEANLLIAGNWARRVSDEERISRAPSNRSGVAADSP